MKHIKEYNRVCESIEFANSDVKDVMHRMVSNYIDMYKTLSIEEESALCAICSILEIPNFSFGISGLTEKNVSERTIEFFDIILMSFSPTMKDNKIIKFIMDKLGEKYSHAIKTIKLLHPNWMDLKLKLKN